MPSPSVAVFQHSTTGLRKAFTLIELMVVIVIISILASLTLAGVRGSNRRAKIEKTKSTIRKIDAVIQPMYDSYRTRRVSTLNDNGTTPSTSLIAASNRLTNLRRLMMYEMPDNWADVATSGTAAPPGLPANASATLLSLCRNGTTRAYAATRPASPNSSYGSAECLYMILSRSGFDPEALEGFRGDEVTDIDADGMREFADGWGRPIAFLRWAPGFSSPYSFIQYADPSTYHDPLDPLRRDANAFALRPLVYSPGQDESLNSALSTSGPSGYGLLQIDSSAGWNVKNLLNICQARDAGNAGLIGAPDPANADAYRDNITNHDLIKK